MKVNKEDTILVTGGRGFLGKALCRLLQSHNYKNVVALPGSNQTPSLNLTSKVYVEHIFRCYKPDIVIHLAARVGGIGANKENPGTFFYENMAMGLNVIEEARLRNCKKFLLTSTVCSYPKHTPVPFKESDIWNGYPEETNAPYGIAKKALMEMLSAYRNQYGFNGITLIPVNMYGPEDNFNTISSHVIPALILKIQRAIDVFSGHIDVWGTGEASREFLYVEDCAIAILKALEVYNEPDPVNLGTGEEIKIKDLVKILCDLMGYSGKVVFDSSKPDGQPRRCLDTGLAEDKFGFIANTKLETGLKNTIGWFRECYPG